VVEEAFKRGAVKTARGKPWTDAENRLLLEMAEGGLNPQQIYDSGRFPERTVEAINKQLERCRFVATRQKAFVETIEPSEDALSMEDVVKFFSTAFEQICSLSVVDKLVLERFRIIFQAARDYGPLLAGYEKWEKIEKQIEELAAAVVELQAAKDAKKAS
jgi:hypothetical protein